jgi:predicted DNA-binding transcriptional regulator YafY
VEDKRLRRLVLFVEQMKRDQTPNCESFTQDLKASEWDDKAPLAVSSKTVQRDITYLRKKFHPPMEYDPEVKGYVLLDKSWSLPSLSLAEDELFAALFSNRVSEPFLPPPIQQTMDEVKTIELAAGEPGDLTLNVLESLVIATGGTVPMAPDTAQAVLRAWKEARRLRVRYVRGSDEAASVRDIDIHALFLSAGAWYARAYCHLRGSMRSFALHRVQKADLLTDHFMRSVAVVDEVRRGRVFDCDFVSNVCVVCARERAMYFRERVWFPGQSITDRPDGSLELRFPSVPAPLFEQWVMSSMGAVSVMAPAELRERIRLLAATLAANHEAGPVA